jgi:hypothetical protein
MMRPTTTLAALISGELSTDDAPDWALSWFSLWLYWQARYVADGSTQAERRDRLSCVPELHRPAIEPYAKRLYAASRL